MDHFTAKKIACIIMNHFIVLFNLAESTAYTLKVNVFLGLGEILYQFFGVCMFSGPMSAQKEQHLSFMSKLSEKYINFTPCCVV